MMMRYRFGFVLLLGFTAAPVFAGGAAPLPLQSSKINQDGAVVPQFTRLYQVAVSTKKSSE